MSKRAIVVDADGKVTNVVLVPDDWTPDSPGWQPPAAQAAEVVHDNSPIGPHWRRDETDPAVFYRHHEAEPPTDPPPPGWVAPQDRPRYRPDQAEPVA